MTAAQVRIATTLEQFYDETEPMGTSGVKYKEAVTKMETQANEEVVSKPKLSASFSVFTVGLQWHRRTYVRSVPEFRLLDTAQQY